jgi:hypothetical protein
MKNYSADKLQLQQKLLRLRYGTTAPDKYCRPLFSFAVLAKYVSKDVTLVKSVIGKYFRDTAIAPKVNRTQAYKEALT